MKRAHVCGLFCVLVSASLTCRFGLLLSSYGRLFIEFLLSQIADDTVAGAFSLKTAQCAFNVFVFSNFNRRHVFSTLLCRCVYFDYYAIIATSKVYVKSFFAVF